MSDVDMRPQEAAATATDAHIDVDDLPSDAEASTSAAAHKSAGPGRPKGKNTTHVAQGSGKEGEQGLQSFLLPKATVTKIAKSAVPPNTKLQKEVPTALTRSAVVFISYLTSLAQEQAAAAGVKTIRPEHVLEALPELDWGEADTARLRKDLKKQLKAFRRNAQAKKEGKPLPAPSTGRGRGRPPNVLAANPEMTATGEEDDGVDIQPGARLSEVDVEFKHNGLLKRVASDAEPSSEEDDDVNVKRIVDDVDGEDEDIESAIEDDVAEEEDEVEEEDDDDIDEADEADPRDFEDDMGQGLDDKRLSQEIENETQ